MLFRLENTRDHHNNSNLVGYVGNSIIFPGRPLNHIIYFYTFNFHTNFTKVFQFESNEINFENDKLLIYGGLYINEHVESDQLPKEK